jgi:hypothetical protein
VFVRIFASRIAAWLCGVVCGLLAGPVAVMAQAGTQGRRALTFPQHPTVPLLAVDADLGGSLALGGGHRTWFGRVGAGLSLWNGDRLIDVTAEFGGWLNERRTLGLGGRYLSAHTGLGATATVMREIAHDHQGHGAWGAGAGVSFSLVNVQAVTFSSDPRASRFMLFVRVPLGLITHELLKVRESRERRARSTRDCRVRQLEPATSLRQSTALCRL